jgi:hypothetical protein
VPAGRGIGIRVEGADHATTAELSLPDPAAVPALLTSLAATGGPTLSS